jgi:DNA-binding transcriptional MerR regulator
MKDMLTIGKIAKEMGFSPKALRIYEKMGIISSHSRGENGYRYYQASQLETLKRLKEFKALGFTLIEIRDLLKADSTMDIEKIKKAMNQRLSLISRHEEILLTQKSQIENILSSLDNKTEPLGAHQRRVIMSYYGKVSIVVTGISEIEKTAKFIQTHFQNANHEIPIYFWRADLKIPDSKPYIVVVKEKDLQQNEVKSLNPDVVVINSVSDSSKEIENHYLNLFADAGPHMTVVFNADDAGSVSLAANSIIKKGRFCYFSKNPTLYSQIENIGGLVSNGKEITIYTFNLTRDTIRLKFSKTVSLEDEIALLSSFGAVMNIGMDRGFIKMI